MAGGSTNGMVLMCTGIDEETKQNELYQMVRGMNAMLIRDKVSSTYDPRTTHLIVGTLGKTEKFLCGLAAGIPMVDVSYVKESQQAGCWIQEIEQYDIGREGHPLRMTAAAGKLVVEDYYTRRSRKMNGGVFKGWRVVVLIENNRQQEIYRRLLELGGARVERWTLQALLDLRDSELSLVTHVVTHPSMLVYDAFRKFVERNDKSARVPVVAYIYVGDFLTKKVVPTVHHFDIRQPAIIDLLASSEIKNQLRPLKIRVPDHLLLPSQNCTSIGTDDESRKMGS